MKPLPVASLLALAACTRAAPPEPAPVSLPPAPLSPSSPPGSVLEPGAWRAPVAPTGAAAPTTPAAPRVAPAMGAVRVRVVRTNDAEGEDGEGRTVPARWPVAIELERAEGWTAGALTATLFVGARHFHNAGYPDLTTARYVVADGRSLPADAEVAIQYGGAARRVLAPSLPVPR